MAEYDTKQVCRNGHHITDRYEDYPERRQEYCDECGEETIIACPNCGETMEGDMKDSSVVAIGFEPTVPDFCDGCGEPFPWTKKEKEDDVSVEIEQPGKGLEFIFSAPHDVASITPISLVNRICTGFPIAANILQDRYDDREEFQINDEADVQDLFHSILRMHFEDVRPEEVAPSRVGASSRIDFLLKEAKVGIEIKMTRDGLDVKKLGEELTVDKERYKSHPDCETLICFIYDPDFRLTNPAELGELEEDNADIDVILHVVPKRDLETL